MLHMSRAATTMLQAVTQALIQALQWSNLLQSLQLKHCNAPSCDTSAAKAPPLDLSGSGSEWVITKHQVAVLQLGSGDRDQRAVQAVLPVYSKKIANPNVVE